MQNSQAAPLSLYVADRPQFCSPQAIILPFPPLSEPFEYKLLLPFIVYLQVTDFENHFSSFSKASKYCADAKDYLEMMCHDLSAELAQFDLQKEKEFKQMLLGYAAAQLEKHEKVSSNLVFLLDFHPVFPFWARTGNEAYHL